MLYSCALIFFLCCSGCLLTISLFSDRWMLVEVALKQSEKIKVTTYVTIGLWETRRVRYYHYYHHYHPFYHHHHGILIYHEPQPVVIGIAAAPALPAQPQPPPTPLRPSVAPVVAVVVAASPPTAPKASLQLSSHLTEKAVLHLSEANSGALVAIRVLLFLCVGLAFGALILLLVTACNDTNVIRHRYKERKLAYTMTGLCAIALLLTIISWSVFLGTMYHSVQIRSNGSDSLNAGFVCCVLASVCLIVSIIMAVFTVDED